MFNHFAIAATLAVLSSHALAAEPSRLYVGGDIGRTDFKQWISDTSYSGFAGYQINENVAVEGGYRRLAHNQGPQWDTKLNQLSLSAIASVPLNAAVSVYGRLGYGKMSTVFTDGDETHKRHETEPVYGLGFTYALSPAVVARIEVQKADSQTTNVSTGLSFRF